MFNPYVGVAVAVLVLAVFAFTGYAALRAGAQQDRDWARARMDALRQEARRRRGEG